MSKKWESKRWFEKVRRRPKGGWLAVIHWYEYELPTDMRPWWKRLLRIGDAPQQTSTLRSANAWSDHGIIWRWTHRPGDVGDVVGINGDDIVQYMEHADLTEWTQDSETGEKQPSSPAQGVYR